ncbi:MAG: carotenoid biosynthesis protein [Bradyrhizobium sp.]|uniref:carotenoid biosynthesis protein n=1 Tax=Bradyrhizobium sp. TaxID=376 RepID=UPI001225F090|nr:carotenoid biosynthesis protein [Bradyrhizobium sp.]THD49942.1 MAG: carotenoid biosynthesis protein [Bradyrhizobium sp.]
MSVQDTVKAIGGRFSPPLETAFWIVLAVYLALVVGFSWNPTPFAQGLATVGIVAACAHAALSYGWKDALALFAICLVITFAIENLGAATGFPFGHYHFEVGTNLPHVGAIPVIVGRSGSAWDISRGSWPGLCLGHRRGRIGHSN